MNRPAWLLRLGRVCCVALVTGCGTRTGLLAPDLPRDAAADTMIVAVDASVTDAGPRPRDADAVTPVLALYDVSLTQNCMPVVRPGGDRVEMTAALDVTTAGAAAGPLTIDGAEVLSPTGAVVLRFGATIAPSTAVPPGTRATFRVRKTPSSAPPLSDCRLCDASLPAVRVRLTVRGPGIADGTQVESAPAPAACRR